MHAIQLLMSEHEKAKQAFAEIEAATANERAALWAKLKPELKAHEEMEEVALYGPAAQDLGGTDQTLKEWVHRHHEEVGEAAALIQEIDGLDATTDDWVETVEELQEALEDHIEEEEGEIWPRIQQAWDQTKLESVGQQMEILKRQKMSRAA